MTITLVLFVLICFFAPYSEALRLEIGPVNLSVPYMLAVAGLVFGIACDVLAGRVPNYRLHTPTLFFVLGYIVLGLVTLVRIQTESTPYWEDATFSVIEQLGRLALCFCIMVFVSNATDESRKVRKGISALVVSAGLVGAYGIYQLVGTSCGFYRPLIPKTGSYGMAPGVEGATRAIGTMHEPSFLAGFLCFSIVMTTMLLVSKLGRVVRPIFWVSLGLQGVCLVMTTSTGGFIGAVAALVTGLIILSGKQRLKFAAIWVIAILILLAPILYLASYTNLQTQLLVAVVEKASHVSAKERIEFIKAGLRMFADHPLVGVGPGMYNAYVAQYTTAFSKSRVLIANNIYVELLAETGLLGTALFSLAYGSLFVRAIRRYTASRRQDMISAGLVIAMLSLAVHFLAYPTFKMEFIWLLFGLIFGHPDVANNDENRNNS